LNGKSVRKSKSIAIAKIVDTPCRESFTLFAISTAANVSIYNPAAATATLCRLEINGLALTSA
jgi:hypothetical protein